MNQMFLHINKYLVKVFALLSWREEEEEGAGTSSGSAVSGGVRVEGLF